MTINEQYEAAKAALVQAKSGEDADALAKAIEEFKAAEAAKKSADEAASIIDALGNTDPVKKEPNMADAKTLGEYAEKNLDLAAVKAGGASRTPSGFKASTDVHVVGEVAVQSQTIVDAQPAVSVRDLFGAEQISGNAITFYQMGATEGDTSTTLKPLNTVEEGSVKPQLHVNYTPVTKPLTKIAGWWYETDELLTDAPYLRSAIDNRGLFELRNAANRYLLQSVYATNGVGQIMPQGDGPLFIAEAILKSIMDIKSATGYDADAIVVTPDLYYDLRTIKDGNATGQYYGGGIFYGPYGNGNAMRQPGLWGLPTIVVPGENICIVGAFRQGASVVTKAGEGTAIEVHRGDHDDAIHNRVTVVVEERLALAVRVPAAFAVLSD